MNNIQRNFKTKSKLRCMADGGSVNPDELGSGLLAKAARAMTGRQQQIDDAVDAAVNGAPTPPPKPEDEEAQRMADGGSLRRGKFTDYYDMGSYKHGGPVKGKGGPTADKVGPVMLSNKEYVLPADTVEAMGGKEALDQVRLATHDFDHDGDNGVDRDNDGDGKRKILRHLRDGGQRDLFDEFAPETKAAPTPPPAAAAPTPRPALNDPARTLSPEAKAYLNPATPPTPAAQPSALSKLGSGLKLAGNIVGRGVGALGVADDVMDMHDNGVTPQNAIGTALDTAALAVPAAGIPAAAWHAGQYIHDNFMSPEQSDKVGSWVNSGLRSVGRAVGQDWGVPDAKPLPQSFQPTAAPSPVTPNTPTVPVRPTPDVSDQGSAQPVTAQSYQSKRLSEMGVPVDVQASNPVAQSSLRTIMGPGGRAPTDPGKFTNLGTFGGDANIYGTSSTPGGRINKFVGVGKTATGEAKQVDPVQQAMVDALGRAGKGGTAAGGDLSQYDRRDQILAAHAAQAEDINNRFSGAGAGNGRKHLDDLNQQTQMALAENDRNMANLRGQNMEAQRADATNLTNLLNVVGDYNTQKKNAGTTAQTDLLKAQLDAQKYQDQRGEKGYERAQAAFGKMFNGDKTKQEAFRAYIEGSDPNTPNGRYFELDPGDQTKVTRDFEKLYQLNQRKNQTAADAGGPVSNRIDKPKRLREVTADDFLNDRVSGFDALKSKVTNDHMVEFDSGMLTPMSRAQLDDNGAIDSDVLKLLEGYTGKSLRRQ